jgi:DNA polymerase-3 subunit epsilon
MLPQNLVFLDLETTGTNPLHDRIIEIGLCEVADGQPDREWSTLVNPEKSFSPFIEQLTGIANRMVTEAPTFDEIAEELFDRLAGKVLVAHNARFDYGFLKNEFRRQGIAFQEKALCTVKLSRALFPEHRRHNLDALVERHALGAQNRHRALGDARLIREFVQTIRDELPAETIGRAVRSQLKQPSPLRFDLDSYKILACFPSHFSCPEPPFAASRREPAQRARRRSAIFEKAGWSPFAEGKT